MEKEKNNNITKEIESREVRLDKALKTFSLFLNSKSQERIDSHEDTYHTQALVEALDSNREVLDSRLVSPTLVIVNEGGDLIVKEDIGENLMTITGEYWNTLKNRIDKYYEKHNIKEDIEDLIIYSVEQDINKGE